MSHIIRQKVKIKHFNMKVLKMAMEMARAELGNNIEITENAVIIRGVGTYGNIQISKDGTMSFDSMDRKKAIETMQKVEKYYTSVATMMALQSMGYDVDFQRGQNGEIQVVGVTA